MGDVLLELAVKRRNRMQHAISAIPVRPLIFDTIDQGLLFK